jgi:hypothetical protein
VNRGTNGGAGDVGPDGWLLALDTATSRIAIAAGRPDGSLIREATWDAGYRHGETLLPALEALIAEAGLRRERLAAVIVGTGPGAFTGLRVGLATAKGLARALGLRIVGVSSAEALLAALDGELPGALALLLPAGPSDRVLVEPGRPPRLIPGGVDPELPAATSIVAVDLADRAPEDALERGERARAGLGAALLRLGAGRVATGASDDLATLVPEYVTLPRGVRSSGGEVTWSRGPR